MSDPEDTQVWRVPEPPAVHEVRLGGGAVTALRRHGNPSGPRIVLSHGNSLAIDLYYPFWSRLAADFDLVLYDLRNHGWNAVGPLRSHNVPTLIDDHLRIQEAIATEFGRKPQAGVFHSLSGLVSLLSPTRGGEFVVRRLMARTTLRRSAGGDGYTLRCPREHEAQIYRYAGQYEALIDFGALACPTMVMGADPGIPYTYFPTTELHHIPTVDYAWLPGGTHLLQLEQPEESVARTLEYLKAGLF